MTNMIFKIKLMIFASLENLSKMTIFVFICFPFLSDNLFRLIGSIFVSHLEITSWVGYYRESRDLIAFYSRDTMTILLALANERIRSSDFQCPPTHSIHFPWRWINIYFYF